MGLIKQYRGLHRDIYFIFISRAINAMGALIFPFLALMLREKIGLNEKEIGIWVAAGGIIVAIGSLAGGKLSDVFGRKKTLITFNFLAAMCYLVCIFLEPSVLLAKILLLSSFLYSMAGPAHEAIIADIVSPDKREDAYSLNYLGYNLGFAMAQLLGGRLFQNHLKIMFLIDAITTIISIGIIGLFVMEHFNNVSKTDKDNSLEKHMSSSIFQVLIGRPVLIYFSIGILGYHFVYSQWSFMVPLFAEYRFPDKGASLYGILGFSNAFLVIIGTPLVTYLYKKCENLKKVYYAGILFSISFGLFGFISSKSAFFISVFIFTLGEILEAISVMPFIMNHTPSSHRGRMGAILPMIVGIGYILGPLVMGFILEHFTYEQGWIIIGAIGMFAAGLIKVLEKTVNAKSLSKSLL